MLGAKVPLPPGGAQLLALARRPMSLQPPNPGWTRGTACQVTACPITGPPSAPAPPPLHKTVNNLRRVTGPRMAAVLARPARAQQEPRQQQQESACAAITAQLGCLVLSQCALALCVSDAETRRRNLGLPAAASDAACVAAEAREQTRKAKMEPRGLPLPPPLPHRQSKSTQPLWISRRVRGWPHVVPPRLRRWEGARVGARAGETLAEGAGRRHAAAPRRHAVARGSPRSARARVSSLACGEREEARPEAPRPAARCVTASTID